MNLDLFLIQNIFEKFAFSQNYFNLAQLDDENPSMTRNPNPARIQDNNERPSTTRNHRLTTIYVNGNRLCYLGFKNIVVSTNPSRVNFKNFTLS